MTSSWSGGIDGDYTLSIDNHKSIHISINDEINNTDNYHINIIYHYNNKTAATMVITIMITAEKITITMLLIRILMVMIAIMIMMTTVMAKQNTTTVMKTTTIMRMLMMTTAAVMMVVPSNKQKFNINENTAKSIVLMIPTWSSLSIFSVFNI